MIHFKKEIAFAKMPNAMKNFKYPDSLKELKDDEFVFVKDIFNFPESKSLEKFMELRKIIVKTPLYVLEQKPSLVKRYLIAAEHLYTYLKKVQKRTNDKENSLVEKLFLLDTIIDEENDKIIFTNYSIIAFLMKYLIDTKDKKHKDIVENFLKGDTSNDFCFYKDGNKYKLTLIPNDKYILAVGVRA